MLELIQIELLSSREIVSETLSRIGIADKKNKIIYPSCHLYFDNGKEYLCHFKELFAMKSGKNNMSSDDYIRRDSVAVLLEDWGLINILNLPEEVDTMFVYCLPSREKGSWKIVNKIHMG